MLTGKKLENRMESLDVEFSRYKDAKITGKRLFTEVTFNPSVINPGESVYISIPTLGANMCLVPDTFFLTAKFKSKNTKSWFLNNLGRLLVKQLQVMVGSREACYTNDQESLYSVYKDLWLPEDQRKNMADVGIMNENTRKLMSADDSADKTVVADKTIIDVFDGRVRIKLGKILNDHGLYAPLDAGNIIKCKLIFPKADEIMVAQSGQKVAGYTLEDVRLEYSSIENPDVYNKALNSFQSRSLVFEDVTFIDEENWGKDTTIINKTINLPCSSMKHIVMLFRKKTLTDSEEYVYPKIKRVDVTIEGNPNSVYSQGLVKSKLFEEARKVFLNHETDTLTFTDFFAKDKFALVIDLRTYPDNDVSGDGRKILNTQNGITLGIKKDKTSEDLVCNTFVVSDRYLNFVNMMFRNLEI